MRQGMLEAGDRHAQEWRLVRPGALEDGSHPLARDLSETVDDFMRLIVAMRHMDEDAEAPRWDAERAGYLALGRLRRSLTRACTARGLE
jgi:hypothetical protein